MFPTNFAPTFMASRQPAPPTAGPRAQAAKPAPTKQAGFGRDGFAATRPGASDMKLARQASGAAMDPGVAASIARLDLRRGAIADQLANLDNRIAAGERGAGGTSLKAQKAELEARDARLASLRQGAIKLGRTPEADGQAVDRYKSLMEQADRPLDDFAAAKLGIEARDIVRNAGRKFPSDLAITHGQQALAERLGYLQDQRQNLDLALANRALSGDALADAPARSAGIEADARLARDLIAAGDRVADRPLPAPAAEVYQLTNLMSEVAQGNVSPQRAQAIRQAAGLLGRP